jgi:DNA-directed RNA polymerase specialized sigma24 family protein
VCAWDRAFEAETTAIVMRVVAGDRDAWRTLMVRLAPRIEGWAKGSRVLRRCRLAGEDDTRAVMVDVLERLAADEFANLRQFLAKGTLGEPPPDLVAEIVRLGRLDEDADPERDESEGTPLRAWLLRLVDFAARDHVRRRLGWGAEPGEPTKRDLHTDAAPLDAAPEAAARPPMTDRLTVSKLVAEVHEVMATFPADMRSALALWLEDVEVAEIAAKLQLPDAARARALVRAGQARLRERFRGRSPLLFA